VGAVRSKVEKLNDGNLIQLFKNRLKAISLADHAIVSTRYLDKKMNSIGIKSTIIDNCISEKFLKNKINIRNRKLKLLYMSGSPTHYADFKLIENILYKFLAENISNDVELNLMGRIDPNSSLNNLPNVNFIPFKKYEQMFEVIDNSDICLVPLEKTEFNSSKSFLKYLECGSRCVPVISSGLDEYRAVIKNGVNGFIAENDKEWEYFLNYCLTNKDDLHKIGSNAHSNIKNNFIVENNINACKELLKIIEA
jgi:glycosyltransferase involved in cell wall biosynthesis